jgi:hypothetical protein
MTESLWFDNKTAAARQESSGYKNGAEKGEGRSQFA